MKKMVFPKVEGYIVTEKIGSGSYSTVYKAYNKVGARETVAIKCVEKARVKHSGAAVDNLVSEIRLLKALRHPHIVRMHDFTWDDKNIYIIMEYCSGGDLAAHIRCCGRLPEPQVRAGGGGRSAPLAARHLPSAACRCGACCSSWPRRCSTCTSEAWRTWTSSRTTCCCWPAGARSRWRTSASRRRGARWACAARRSTWRPRRWTARPRPRRTSGAWASSCTSA